jgi:hypothetical protein
MAYSDFTLAKVIQTFKLIRQDEPHLFPPVPEVTFSPFFQTLLAEYVPLGLSSSTEKSRSEFIIAPVLAELRKLANYRISLFSGVNFTVEPENGLNGVCDFIISRSPEQLYITAPILIIIEAKNENINAGMGQCIAAMVATQIFNTEAKNSIPAIYGVVTTGSLWKFLKLEGTNVQTDPQEYYFRDLSKILGILLYMVEADSVLPV